MIPDLDVPEPTGESNPDKGAYRPEDLALSIGAQVAGALRTIDSERLAETMRSYMAGEIVLAVAREGIRIIPVDQLPDPDDMGPEGYGYL